ncbi:putative inorganic carbon transporter subunit DabA [Nocardioides sp.]|uniref:putative inorganic carbon transporter subunit DabA n=1 Tax=Nocardioides sp. TaxID=35761 RepID=UPI0037843345
MNPLVAARRSLATLAGLAVALAALVTGLVATRVELPPAVDGGPDALRVVLMVYVALLGWLVATYAATNLRGQPRPGRFAALLVATVLGLLLMVTAEELVVAAIGWTVSGTATAALVAHRDDPRARRASRVVGVRLAASDLALWLAVLGWYAGAPDGVVGVAVAVAVVVRSALVPAHRWLPETAEAPSPVSALLHAGVVNGGAMLGLLFWPLLGASRAALLLLLVVGLVSVGVGLVTMRLRPDVKGRLAASTTAQMGLVAVQLGLALPAAALLHVLGHGCWKAWLFLRAGGSVERQRLATRAVARDAAGQVLATCVAVCLVAAVVVAAGSVGRDAAGLVLPAVLAAAVAGVGVREALRLERNPATTRLALTVAAALVPAAYLGWVAAAEALTGTWFDTGTDGPAPGYVALPAALLVVALGLGAARLSPVSSGAVPTAVAASLLPPGARAKGSLDVTPTEPATLLGGLPAGQLGTVVALAAGTVGPAWPLRSMVAANPLAPLEKLAVEDAAATVRLLHGRDPRPRLHTFLDLHSRGVVPDHALRRSLAEHDPTGPSRPGVPRLGSAAPGPLSGISPADLVEFTRAIATGEPDAAPLRARACDHLVPATGPAPAEVLDLQLAAWTARAWSTTTPDGESDSDPWTLWRSSMSHRLAGLTWGVAGTDTLARELPADPALAVAALWPRVERIVGDQDLYTYLTSVLAAGRGWAAHASWRARTTGRPTPLLQLVALHMALDVVLAEAALSRGARRTPPVLRPAPDAATTAHLVSVWQRGLDLSARDGLLRGLTGSAAGRAGSTSQPAPAVSSVWCIDARSERVRRHLERHDGHATFGYAGFFGAPVRHLDADGHAADLCPGILRPATDVAEAASPLPPGAALRRLLARTGSTPAAAFGWAEMSGAPALAGIVAASLVPARWRSWGSASAPTSTRRPVVERLPHALAVDAAEQLLRSTGLAEQPTGTVVLVGHRSSTENNAFASAYDCGACGGNSGAVNATLVADALNDPQVRAALAERGVAVPASTLVVAAAHDTTTDRVVLLRDRTTESAEAAARLDRVAAELAQAGADAAAERGLALPTSGRGRRLHPLEQRAADWAEPMPEWGLAGNMALVVGPRELTAPLDLGGTAFLHSYEPELDADGSLLEQIMTGPVVVTQWISSQYYFSASAPELLGAGDKTTHNVVGDVGVLTGAHGDIRCGLPWQAVASHDPVAAGGDTSHLRHLPVRHLVVVTADPRRVSEVVERHAALHQAVGNGWMQLVSLPPTGEPVELDRNLQWQPCVVPGLPTGDAEPSRRQRA